LYCASDVCITSKLWLIRSSNDAGPTLSMMNEPVADFGAPGFPARRPVAGIRVPPIPAMG
jgi:hypothetical protein